MSAPPNQYRTIPTLHSLCRPMGRWGRWGWWSMGLFRKALPPKERENKKKSTDKQTDLMCFLGHKKLQKTNFGTSEICWQICQKNRQISRQTDRKFDFLGHSTGLAELWGGWPIERGLHALHHHANPVLPWITQNNETSHSYYDRRRNSWARKDQEMLCQKIERI